MKTINRHIIILVFNLLFFNLFGQKDVKLNGFIYDSISNHPVEYAAIAIYTIDSLKPVAGCITNNKGKFAIENLSDGNYQIIIQHVGFRKKIIKHTQTSENKRIELGNIYLIPNEILLKEAEITAEYDYMEFKMNKKVVNVGKHINADAGNVIDILSGVPSIQSDADGNITLRGSSNFIVLIDGRPSVINGKEALNQIPANTVEKVEIITNPGAKYEAEGAMGIVNLIMKKQRSLGTSGQATAKIATGNKYSGNIYVNTQSKKWITQLGATYSNKRKRTESKDERDWYNQDTAYSRSLSSERDITRQNNKLEGMVAYNFNDKNSISFNAEIGNWKFDRDIQSNWINKTEYDSEKFYSKNTTLVENYFSDGALNYQHKFQKEGHNMSVDIFFSCIDNYTPNEIFDREIDNITESYTYLKNQSYLKNLRSKFDYSLPITEKTSINSGFFFQTNSTQTSYYYDQNLANNQYVNEKTTGSYHFNREEISGYLEAETEAFGFHIQTGLRFENTSRKIKNEGISKLYETNYLVLFPSLQISRSFENNQDISFGYSKRITRPDEWMLIPILNSTGRNLLHIGNPELQFEMNHLVEFSYNYKNEKTMLSTNIYADYSHNYITETIEENNNIFYETNSNIEDSYSSGADIMWNQKISKWFKFSLASYIQYSKLSGHLDGFEVKRNQFTYGGNLRGTFNLTKSTLFEALGIYYGPTLLAQGNAKHFYYIDFFVKQYLLKKQLIITASTHNTFDSGIYIANLEGENFKTYTWFNYEGPVFYISITYKWNNYRRKQQTHKLNMNFDSGLDH